MSETQNTETKVVRNRLKREDIARELNSELVEVIKDAKLLEVVQGMITAKFSTSGYTAMPNKVVDGVEYAYCSRTETYHPLSDMMLAKDGSSLGYSKVSQAKLVETNATIKALQSDLQTAVLDGNMEQAVKIGNKLKKVTDDKNSGAIYR